MELVTFWVVEKALLGLSKQFYAKYDSSRRQQAGMRAFKESICYTQCRHRTSYCESVIIAAIWGYGFFRSADKEQGWEGGSKKCWSCNLYHDGEFE